MKDIQMNNIFDTVINNDICIGCGVCAGLNAGNVEMQDNVYGQYIPEAKDLSAVDQELCWNVCPFANNGKNEDSIAKANFGGIDGIKHTSETGYYLNCYAAYVNNPEERKASTSGGMITGLAKLLLDDGIVDSVVCVKSIKGNSDKYFDYAVIKDSSELDLCKKSRYYPVEMSGVIDYLLNTDDKVLFIGLPCFNKAINLLEIQYPKLKETIVYKIGLFCGHLKTKNYAKYLMSFCGVTENQVETIDFRKKIDGKFSNQYAFEAIGKKAEDTNWIIMRDVWASGWSNNLFMLKACEYCDDIYSETADLSVGDVWLPEYMKDAEGTSLVVCRNDTLNKYLLEKTQQGHFTIKDLSIEDTIKSQMGGLRQRRKGLQYRLWLADKKKQWRPVKRVKADKLAGINLFRIVQKLRLELRVLSHEAFLEQQKMAPTSIEHFKKRLAFRVWLMGKINKLRKFKIVF